MEDWIIIRNLKKRNPRMGTRKIAKKLGLSRKVMESPNSPRNAEFRRTR